MLRVVLLQFVASLLVAAIAAWAGGAAAAGSAVLGGMACWLPNGLFALNLALLARRAGNARASDPDAGNVSAVSAALVPLLLGEFLKVLLTVALLALVVLSYKDLVWLALVASAGAALLVQPVALALPQR